jgi:hypothetical protein
MIEFNPITADIFAFFISVICVVLMFIPDIIKRIKEKKKK